jgi:hypothetical protein
VRGEESIVLLEVWIESHVFARRMNQVRFAIEPRGAVVCNESTKPREHHVIVMKQQFYDKRLELHTANITRHALFEVGPHRAISLMLKVSGL